MDAGRWTRQGPSASVAAKFDATAIALEFGESEPAFERRAESGQGQLVSGLRPWRFSPTKPIPPTVEGSDRRGPCRSQRPASARPAGRPREFTCVIESSSYGILAPPI